MFFRVLTVQIDGKEVKVMGAGETRESADKNALELADKLKAGKFADGKIHYEETDGR